MATDEWIVFNDRELVNLSRTAQLAEAMGIDAVWTRPEDVQWVQDALGGVDYSDITAAPWYVPSNPASAEFAGVVPLSFVGLDDSTLTASTIEYITDGGRAGRPRHETLPIVGSVMVVASTERGAQFGKMWVDKVLRCDSNRRMICAGWELEYFKTPASDFASEIVNRDALASWFAKDPLTSVKRLGVAAGTSIDDGSLASSYALTWPAQVQQAVRDRFNLPGGAGYISSTPSTGGAIVPPLPVASTGTVRMWEHGLGGRAMMLGNAAHHVTYDHQPCTRVKVYYGKTSIAGGGLKVEIDGVDQGVTLSSSGSVNSGGHVWESPELTPGMHEVKIIPFNPPYVGIVEGVEFINQDEDFGFRVYNGGHSGGGVTAYNTSVMGLHWESVNAMGLDLAIVNLGANDIASQTVPAFLSGIDTILGKINPDTPVLLVGNYLRGDYNTEAGLEKWAEMMEGLRARAVGRVAFLDIGPHWPTLVPDGSTSAGLMWDTPPIHPNTAGMTRMAEILLAELAPDVDRLRVHRRDVRTTRGATVTRKRSNDCSVLWQLSFTLTAGDPYEYGNAYGQVSSAINGDVAGANVVASGTESMTYSMCPVFDYTPTFDPLFPALITPPSAPEFRPESWLINEGDPFVRTWVELGDDLPDTLTAVPMIRVRSSSEARMVRVSLWDDISDTTTQCDPLFSAMITYLPANTTLYIDGEQKAAYVWDGVSPVVSRADTLVFRDDARPVQWQCFWVRPGLGVTLDVFTDHADPDEVELAFSLIQRSD